mmetsp:Transcript_26237/g.55661  ORF Transcript_26237/g.55661 Transcript_26237/m.55661 type:complete len:361 (-) Transcript_26237:1763-2845(-)
MCQPSPQLLLQALQAPQWANLQGSGSTVLHPAVSSRMPLHDRPPFSGISLIFRERYFCPLTALAAHWLHSDHSDTLQSFFAWHSAGQVFVSRSEPPQGSPHSLLVCATRRCRSQRPVHVGVVHSPQESNKHGLGMHSGVQLLTKGHTLTFSWLPVHLLLSWPWKMKPFVASFFKVIARFRMVVAEPQPALHEVESDHSVHTQNAVLWQVLVQFDTSLATFGSHGFPQWFGSFSMERCLKRCPPHLLQSPHSDQEPHWQSWQSRGWQRCVLQGIVMMRVPSQGLPPWDGGVTTDRFLSIWPPPQGAVQTDHFSHSPSLQSTAGFSPQSEGTGSPTIGLQGSITLSGESMHGLPLPEAKTLM